MRIFFSVEDRQGWQRTLHLRAALLKRGHRIVPRTPLTPRPPRGTDLWLYGLTWDPRPPMSADAVEALRRFDRPIAFFQSDDDLTFYSHRIPQDLLERAAIFLRNQWYADESRLPDAVRGAPRGFITPLLRYAQPVHAGEPLHARRRVAMFYGAGTGSPTNDTVGARERTVRLLRTSGLPFEGGIVEASRDSYEQPEDLAVARISQRAHALALRSARICVAPWGNNPITYRLFEGLAYRCLVVAQSLGGVRFADMGLEPGVHYVEVRADLSDLVERVSYYLEHDDQAQRIADAGHAHCTRFFTWRGLDVPDPLVDAVLATWGDVLRPVAAPSLASRLLRRALPVLPYV